MIEKSNRKMFVISIVLGLTFGVSYITYQSAYAIEPGCTQNPYGPGCTQNPSIGSSNICSSGTLQNPNICVSDKSSSN